MNDIERDRLGGDMALLGFLDIDFNQRSGGNDSTGVPDNLPLHAHSTLFDQPHQPGPRQVGLHWHIAGERLIKAGRRSVRNGKSDTAVRHE